MNPNIDEARRFLAIVAPTGAITFQTFSDRKAKAGPDPLARVFHGTLDEHAPSLIRLSEAGAGVFFMVNEGDGIVRKGRKTCRTKDNVIAVRALFVDLDGAPLPPLGECAAPPKIIVESSPGRYHGYWPGLPCPLDAFEPAQVALARRFGGDESVSDLPRVMRLPGFAHQKGEPFMTKIILPTVEGRP